MDLGFTLTDHERRILNLPEDKKVWPVADAPVLLDMVDEVAARLLDIDPTHTRNSAERNFALSRQIGDTAILGKMRQKIAPFAGEGLGDSVENFLKSIVDTDD